MNLANLLTDTENLLSPIFGAMEVAEKEIREAQNRHPDAADRIWRSFKLLVPSTDLLTRNESVYRAHCRELLDRVAAGADTRPGTAAECCVALCETSLRVPLSTSAAGLYARMWKAAGLPEVELTDSGVHCEALERDAIDRHEVDLRARLSQADRQLDPATADAAADRPRTAATVAGTVVGDGDCGQHSPSTTGTGTALPAGHGDDQPSPLRSTSFVMRSPHVRFTFERTQPWHL